MSKHLVKSLITEIFNDWTPCGPNKAHKAWHHKVDYSYSSHLKGLVPHIIPDNTYHPDIKIGIDFTHRFVLKSEHEELQGKRLVSKELLKNTGIRLAKFFSYYFDYILSYGENKTNKEAQGNLKIFIDKIKNMDSEYFTVLPFINNILNYFITGVQIERSRTGIGTCTITLRDNPNYCRDVFGNKHKINMFLNKSADVLNQLLVPMLPITVWARGRLFKDWYFPIFDGYIMTSQPANAQGFTTITITCRDTLELARISQEMINPAIIQLKEFRKQTAINIFSKPLYGLDHMRIFDMMFHGGAIIYDPDGGNFVDPNDARLRSMWAAGHKGDYLNFTALGTFLTADEELGDVDINALDDLKVIHKDNFDINTVLKKTSHIYRPRCTSTWGYNITPYRLLEFQAPNVFTSEFSSRLDVMRSVAGLVYYEFYVDGFGTVHYHPMRLINDFLYWDRVYTTETVTGQGRTIGNVENRHLSNFPGAQIIGPEETMNVSSLLNIEELTTVIRLSGVNPVIGESAQPELLDLIGGYVDKRYMQRYGYRRREIKNPMFNYNKELKTNDGKKVPFLDVASQALLNYMNAELFSRTATIIFRPELELAMPVLFTDDNSVFYVQSISHSITIGGNATTTLNANFGRKDMQQPADLVSLMITSEKLYKTQGKFVQDPEDPAIAVIPYGGDPGNMAEWEKVKQDEMDEIFGKDDKMGPEPQHYWDEEDPFWGMDKKEKAAKSKQIKAKAARKKELEKQKKAFEAGFGVGEFGD